MKHERISINPQVMVGKPCIKGTRIPVEQVLRELAEGITLSEVIETHPSLTEADILAAIDYAADVVRQAWLMTQPALLGKQSDAFSS